MKMDAYNFKEKIGHGACSQVYRAEKNERSYAIKKILRDDDKPTRTKLALQQEAEILTSLKHPYIIGCHESFFDNEENYLYIVQDYCEEGTLSDKLKGIRKEESLLEEDQVMQWFCEVCLAVQHCHDNKILHRDIKADNIFVTKKGSLKLGDFGIAKQLADTWDKASTMCGTPIFLSPEMCQDQPYSTKSDIWALGCLLFEMCALRPPFDSQNLISLFYKIVKSEPQELPARYSAELKQLISRLLTKTPDQRPSVGEVIQDDYVSRHMSALVAQREVRARGEDEVDAPLRHIPHSSQVSPTKAQNNLTAAEYEDDFEDSSDEDTAEADYESDFESDSEEDLGALVERAQHHPDDTEFFAEPSSVPFTSLLEKHCIATLGKSCVEEIKALYDADDDDKRSTLKLVVGEELVETCYFASELLK